MREERQHKETQSRVIQPQAQKQPQGAYIVDNRDNPQIRLMKAIQRMGMEEEKLQMKPITQLQSEDEELQMKPVAQLQSEDEELQMKPIVQLQSEDDELLQGKFETIQQKPNNTGLPDNLKSGVENMSGFSMDDVRVHYNSDKPAQMQAHAYAQGTDIHVAPGQEKHLAHEAWHVVQQKQGRVQPTIQMQGVGVNNDDSLENEADRMGGECLKNNSLHLDSCINTSKLTSTNAIQRQNQDVKITWAVTHIVEKKDNSLFHAGKDFTYLEKAALVSGTVITIDKNAKFTSRRDHNQENEANREANRACQPSKEWYKVVVLKEVDVMDKNYYIRDNTFNEIEVNNYTKIILANESITIDPLTDHDTYTELNIQYKSGHINCKLYNEKTKKITSSNFTGCIMAIFKCIKDIDGIASGKTYAAHVANDNNISYLINGVQKNVYGKVLLADLAEGRYINNLRYFRPSYRYKDDKSYSRTLKRMGQRGVGKEQETGIIRFNAGVGMATHKFDTDSPNEENQEIATILTSYTRDWDHQILEGKEGYIETILQKILIVMILARNKAYTASIECLIKDMEQRITSPSDDFLDLITCKNVDIGKGNYALLPKVSRDYYMAKLKGNSSFKVPQWLKSDFYQETSLKYLDSLVLGNIDIGKLAYSYLNSDKQASYRDKLKNSTDSKVPQWLKKEYWWAFFWRKTM